MFAKFPSIEQFKNIIYQITSDYRFAGIDENGQPIFNNDPLPVLKFIGTPKCHGTNGSIVYDKNTDEILVQSRGRIIKDISNDNLGFLAYVLKNKNWWKSYCNTVVSQYNYDSMVIFGEWAGPGIQSKVALSTIPEKIFVIFSILFRRGEEEIWIINNDLQKYIPECIHNVNAYNVTEFNTWEIDIDFNSPVMSQNKLIELCESVERECPVGKYFGISGIGEGIVFSCYGSNNKIYRFKVKGELHQSSKVKTLAPIDEEAYNSIKSFVKNCVTEARLEQGIFFMENELLVETTAKNTGIFINWVKVDVFKEENAAIIVNKLDPKKVAAEIANVARTWYWSRI